MTRTGDEAIAYARSRVGGTMPASGYCLQFVRQCFDVGSYYASAIDAWNGAPDQHPGDRNPPPAVPLFFATPSVYDHVTFCASTSEVISTFNADIRSFSGIASIEANFNGTYLGWTESINGVTVYTGGGTRPMPGPPEENDEKGMPMQHLMQIDPNVDGRWFLVSYGAGIAQRVWNGTQLDLIRRDTTVDQVVGAQPPSTLDGLTIRGE
jgi:hypothetical protein